MRRGELAIPHGTSAFTQTRVPRIDGLGEILICVLVSFSTR